MPKCRQIDNWTGEPVNPHTLPVFVLDVLNEPTRKYRAVSVAFSDLKGHKIVNIEHGNANSMPGKGVYESMTLTLENGTRYVIWQAWGEVNLSILQEVK